MNENSNELGTYLKAVRENLDFTLRAVEDATGISNAYLSQLEKGKVKQPSPTILHKLAEHYSVSYADLLELANYPVPDNSEDRQQTTFAKRAGSISPQEADALLVYLDFLRSRKIQGDDE